MVKTRASKYRGVYRCGTKWKTQIQIDGTQHYLGVFDDQESASEAYKSFARKNGRFYMIEDLETKDKDGEEFGEDSSVAAEETREESIKNSSREKILPSLDSSRNVAESVKEPAVVELTETIPSASAAEPDTFNSSSFTRSIVYLTMDRKMKILFTLKLLKILLGKCVHRASLNNLQLFSCLSSKIKDKQMKDSIQRIKTQSLRLSECIQSLVSEIMKLINLQYPLESLNDDTNYSNDSISRQRRALQSHFSSLCNYSSSRVNNHPDEDPSIR